MRDTRSPNILLIVSDDHAAPAISCYGSDMNRTPNIDRIGDGGMRFNNCFCTNAICTPARGSILTGKYSHKTGIKTLADTIDSHTGTDSRTTPARKRIPDSDCREMAPRTRRCQRSTRIRLLECVPCPRGTH